MPNPLPNESKNNYLKRCIPILTKDEGKPQKQAIAICYSMFDKYKSKNGHISTENTNYLLTNFDKNLNQITLRDRFYYLNEDQDTKNNITDSIIEKIKKPNPTKLTQLEIRSINNKINFKPQGIIITDTVNNPVFPIDIPIIDDSKFNLPNVKKRFQLFYCPIGLVYLPWHYVVEIINGKYYFFNTRPVNMKFPVTTMELNELLSFNRQYLNITDSTDQFLKNPQFEIANALHICIIGDSNYDVYMDDLYQNISRICIEPYLDYFKLGKEINIKVINFNLGKKFLFEKLQTYIRR